jgi:hypothetical protein
MMEPELKTRTKRFALRIIRLTGSRPKTMPADVMARHLARTATSVAANHRACCRARSKAGFVAKLGGVGAELLPAAKLAGLRNESHELTAIFVASLKTARRRGNLKSAIQNPK